MLQGFLFYCVRNGKNKSKNNLNICQYGNNEEIMVNNSLGSILIYIYFEKYALSEKNKVQNNIIFYNNVS